MFDTFYLWGIFFITLLVCAGIIGKLMAVIFDNSIERFEDKVIRFLGVDSKIEMSWKEYLLAILLFNAFGFVLLHLILMMQHLLPLNPEHREGLSFWTAFNISSSFVSNTNWQNYSGESTLSYFSQMFGLTVQNFLSASSGVAVLLAFIRALTTKEIIKLGNFWSDISRFIFRILLPLSLGLSFFLVSQGVPQTFKESMIVKTLEEKTIKVPLGPVASQVAIKMTGTNGGGYYNANSTHPYENPTPLSNFIQSIFILLIPVACFFMFIFMIPSKKEGYMLLFVALILLFLGILISYWGEASTNSMTKLNFLEGTETRFSLAECSLWSVATTAASNGSVNCMHSSLPPLAQLVSFFNMMTGEVIFGGVGSGLYGLLLYVLLTVFLAGLMVGRTPEYLGKKIETKEVVWIGVAILSPGFLNLIFSAFSLNTQMGLTSLSHNGIHGLSEVLYAFSSSFGNNGSSFAGLNANTNYYNITTGFAMLFGRFIVIIAVMKICGSLGIKRVSPIGPGTLRTDTGVFAALLLGVIFIIGALTFFPVLLLGPIAEQMLLQMY